MTALEVPFVNVLFDVTNITTPTTTTSTTASGLELLRVQLGAYFGEVVNGGDKVYHILVVRGNPSCTPTCADFPVD